MSDVREETRTWRGELAVWIATGLGAGAVAWAADPPAAAAVRTIAHLVPVAHDGGDLGQARQTRRAPPAFARDDDIAPAGFMDKDRLDHAHRFDRRGQFAQRVLAEAAARLIAVGIDFAQAQAHHRVG